MNYNEYHFSYREWIKYLSICAVVAGTFAFFFYRSLIAFAILLPVSLGYLRIKRKDLIDLRKKKLMDEFAEMLYSVSAAMLTGYSLENAFKDSLNDIRRFYGKDSVMAEEIVLINNGLKMNIPLEELVGDLGERSGVEDILVFSEVFRTAKRNGGNIREVMYKTATVIREKTRIEKEIQLIIAEKRFELTIMEGIPFFIIIYVGLTTQGYFDELYNNLFGVLFMSACLVVYVGAVIIGKRIIDIKV